jgi:hypothetical protein
LDFFRNPPLAAPAASSSSVWYPARAVEFTGSEAAAQARLSWTESRICLDVILRLKIFLLSSLDGPLSR